MRHVLRRPAPAHPSFAAVAALLLTTVVAACGTGTAAGLGTPPPASPTAAVTAGPAATPPPTTAAQIVVTTPSPAPETFESPLYAYVVDRPSEAGVTSIQAATERWDGASAIASSGPMVDQLRRSDQRLAFLLSAPTDLDLASWEAAVHRKAAVEHSCTDPLQADIDITISGAPARLSAFPCQDLMVLEATSVRAGVGLIAKQIGPPPAGGVVDQASLDDFISLLARVRWGS